MSVDLTATLEQVNMRIRTHEASLRARGLLIPAELELSATAVGKLQWKPAPGVGPETWAFYFNGIALIDCSAVTRVLAAMQLPRLIVLIEDKARELINTAEQIR